MISLHASNCSSDLSDQSHVTRLGSQNCVTSCSLQDPVELVFLMLVPPMVFPLYSLVGLYCFSTLRPLRTPPNIHISNSNLFRPLFTLIEPTRTRTGWYCCNERTLGLLADLSGEIGVNIWDWDGLFERCDQSGRYFVTRVLRMHIPQVLSCVNHLIFPCM
ncbi:hypothetical protein EDB19DRAFT_265720 [Suillus lakei]|nr:hypothetical protein EDB19DRAFT_265720 [Suillus lakei]